MRIRILPYLLSAFLTASAFPFGLPQSNTPLVIPEGTVIQLSLREPVSSKLSDPGDEVRATVKKDVVVNGAVLLREGTEVFGRVTLAQPAKRPLRGGKLHITFERVRLDVGIDKKLVALVQSASDFNRDEKIGSNSEGTLKGGKSGGDAVRNASMGAGLGGAAAGIVILAGHSSSSTGLGLGNVSRGTAVGAAGALGGGLVAGVLLTKGKEVRLDSGTVVRLKLERALALE